ncbi:terpenoid synthase [Phellopilus nigrolimitatus]|nr:terpenoid synthase [Phellopilus nigrolimitatus]
MSLPISYKLPDLISMCNLSSSIHPRYKEAGAESAAWISSYEPLGPETRAFFDKLDTAILSGLAYPYAGYKELRMCCDYINVLFAMDEVTDVQNGADARKTVDIHIRALHGEQYDDSAVSKMTLDFRSRFLELFALNSFLRFLPNHENYANAVIREAERRDRYAVLSLKEYEEFRRVNGGVLPSFNLIECCFKFHLPDEVIEHPTIKRMTDAAISIICWSNDIYSYHMELVTDGHSCSNVITVIMQEKRYTLQGAMDYVGSHIQSLLSQFIADKAALPSSSFGTEIDANLHKYIHGLETWITGNLRYSFKTPRYFGDEREEVEKTLVVRMNRRNTEAF